MFEAIKERIRARQLRVAAQRAASMEERAKFAEELDKDLQRQQVAQETIERVQVRQDDIRGQRIAQMQRVMQFGKLNQGMRDSAMPKANLDFSLGERNPFDDEPKKKKRVVK